ncbi:MAG: enolase C-terminal domain-like protein [Candidatus Brocadiia bacterium]
MAQGQGEPPGPGGADEPPRPPTAADAARLAEHRIAEIHERRLHDRFPRRVGRNATRGHAGRGGGYQVRTLVTDKGVRGWGMSWVPRPRVEKLIGARVGDIYDLERGTADEAFVIDLPLHDLVGHILGKPVYALLGARGPARVPIYSGAIYFEDLDPQDAPRGVPAVLEACQQDYRLGYRAFKLKMGRGRKWMPREEGQRRDIEVTRAVRERFPDCEVLVDANDGYRCEDFLAYVSAVADCRLFWIEEPFREARDDYRRLRDHMARVGCKALIADGEARTERAEKPWRYGDYSRRHVETLFALAREKLVDVLLLDLGIVGYTRWRRVMPELAKAGVLASPHTWMWTPRPYYAAHLAAGAGNVCIVEGIPGEARGIDYSAYTFEDGKLVMPRAPGFGLGLQAGA